MCIRDRLKSAVVRAGLLVVERQFGTLEFHSQSTDEVHAAADAVLNALSAKKEDAIPPKILALSLIHISEPTRLLSISYAVFCLKKKKKNKKQAQHKR